MPTAVSILRVFLVPLCAALVAALLAHIGIDVLGDYVLPHDSYDDVAHASRPLVMGLVSVVASSLALLWLADAVREAAGSVEALARTLHTSVSLGRFPFFSITFALAAIVLVAMEAADVRWAGGAIDDVADLFGGSIALGFGTLLAAVFGCAFGARRLVRALANVRRTLVHALASAFATRGASAPCARMPRFARVRILERSRLFDSLRFGRAPPLPLSARPF